MLFLLQNCLQSLRFYLVLPELLSSLTSTNIPQCEQCNLKERRKTSCILQGSVSTKGNHEQTVLATCELLSFFSQDLMTANFNTEKLISTVCTLPSHSFPPSFQTKQFLLLSALEPALEKKTFTRASVQEALWLDKIQWSSYCSFFL